MPRLTRHPTTGSLDRPLALGIFRSPFGWIAAAVSQLGVVRIQMGHPDRRSSRAALNDAIGLGPGYRDSRFRAVQRLAENVPSAANSLLARLGSDLERYVAGQDVAWAAYRLDIGRCSTFRRSVLEACRAIPAGETLSYGQLAAQVGSPRSARAVGRVMATNPVPLIVPCHRVVGSDGRMTGFSAPTGVDLKRRLLELEGAPMAITHRSRRSLKPR